MLVYTVKASCVVLVFRLKSAKFIIKMTDLFSSCRTTIAEGANTRNQNSKMHEYCSAKHEWHVKTVLVRYY